MTGAKKARTVLDALVEAVGRGAAEVSEGAVGPAAVLWTDKERQWEPLLPVLKKRLPSLLVLGSWAPTERTGPATWLRCVLGGTLPEAALPDWAVPVLYLPEVSRADLRAVEECPRPLQPLAELQYRGVFFSQKNGKDWTVRAFLESDGGLGLDVAHDEATGRAMLAAVLPLAERTVQSLAGKRLEAIDFNEMVAPDVVKSLLSWMSDPKGTKGSWAAERWKAFVHECKETLRFDPGRDGELDAAERMGSRDGGWETVWERFEEAPQNYPGVVPLLEKAEPKRSAGDLFHKPESWPGATDREEDALRADLLALTDAAPLAAAKKLAELETRHGARRGWLWARLGRAPLAVALEHLAAVAVAAPVAGATAADLAEAWAGGGWKVDAAALRALAAVEKAPDVKAVHAALRAVYLSWLDAGARRLQELSGKGLPVAEALAAPDTGTCVLFADGLRFDVARALEARLSDGGASVNVGWRWAALPTVTATAKPAVSPVATGLLGGPAAEFQAATADGKPLTPDRFRKLLDGAGIQVLSGEATGDPAGRAWTEAGTLDKVGHDQGAKLARRVAEEVRELAGRVQALLDAGWREVRVVTDHGWLLLPGDLPKVDLPKFLAESRWGRCAALKESVTPNLPLVPWRWDPAVWVAVAPGVATFYKGMEYAHGGVSLQECVIPVVTVRATAGAGSAGKIGAVKWTSLRCKVSVEGAAPGSRVDIRQKVGDASTSVLAKEAATLKGGDAEVALYASDEHEGAAAFVVLLGPDGSPMAKVQTVVGGGEG
ncbi:MAG: BREX-1 system phosphatase PglZ type B [Holophagales bacterium]|nr:BREX-1 system phosphatase PglZ type B [Holophagales bacterium]